MSSVERGAVTTSRGEPVKAWLKELSRWLPAVALVQACHQKAQFPPAELNRVSSDERVDDWRVSGEKGCPRVIQAIDGCYVLEVKYVADYTRVKGGASRLWGVSPLAAAIDTAVRTHTTNYETGYVLFALQVRRQHNYYVTATFDGDEFAPRIVESNEASERTQEVFPAASLQELEECKHHGPRVSASDQDVCGGPAPASGSPGRPW